MPLKLNSSAPLEVEKISVSPILSTIDLLENIKVSRDQLFENKLLNGFKDQNELKKYIKQ